MPAGQLAVNVTKFRNLGTPSAEYVLYFKFWYRQSSISTSIGEVQFLKLWLSQFSFHISSSNVFKRFPPRRRSLFSTKCYIMMDSTWRIKNSLKNTFLGCLKSAFLPPFFVFVLLRQKKWGKATKQQSKNSSGGNGKSRIKGRSLIWRKNINRLWQNICCAKHSRCENIEQKTIRKDADTHRRSRCPWNPWLRLPSLSDPWLRPTSPPWVPVSHHLHCFPQPEHDGQSHGRYLSYS